MNARKHAFLVIVVFLLVQFAPKYSAAWWPIAHYEITKNAGYPDIAEYAQLPDYVESLATLHWVGGSELFYLADISHYFLWAHAAQKSERTPVGPVVLTHLGWPIPPIVVGSVPWKPVYPDDGRYPGVDMWYLIQNKMKGLSQEDKLEMENTAKGFIAHNAADRVVHYDVFSGAGVGDSAQQGYDKWLIHHQAKEKWADYWIYFYEYFVDPEKPMEFDYEDAFENGVLKLVPAYAQGVPVAAPTLAMTRIMQLSQKVYEKNRRFTNFGEEFYTVKAQSMTRSRAKFKRL